MITCYSQIIGLYLSTQLKILLVCVLVFWETESHTIAQAGLKWWTQASLELLLVILLSQLLKNCCSFCLSTLISLVYCPWSSRWAMKAPDTTSSVFGFSFEDGLLFRRLFFPNPSPSKETIHCRPHITSPSAPLHCLSELGCTETETPINHWWKRTRFHCRFQCFNLM